jgi:tRNA (cytidine/uridine-2'-O-)-methyltransferase
MPRIVLYQPQIPPNTGNVARTCAATDTELHLVEPLGFQIDDRQLKRAGLDYWPLVSLVRHGSWDAFLNHRSSRGGRLIALSSHGGESYGDWLFSPEDWLLFGRESDGLPAAVLSCADAILAIPMARAARATQPGVRSLNLSVAVGVVLFEALRQQDLLTLPGSPTSTGISAAL